MGPIPTGGPPGKISMCIIICNVHPYTYIHTCNVYLHMYCILGFSGIAFLSKWYGIEKIPRYH